MSFNLYQRQRQHNLQPILNSTWYDDEGKNVYKVHTPFALSPYRTTTVSKFLRGSASDDDAHEFPNRTDEGNVAEVDNAVSATSLTSHDNGGNDNFMYLAQIDWKVIKSSNIRFGFGRYSGREIQTKEYLKKQDWGIFAPDRLFTGEDGKEYKWLLGRLHPELILNDDSKILVAQFHRESHFSTTSSRLEIFPQGQHMMDEIFITFIYLEQLRKAQERQTKG